MVKAGFLGATKKKHSKAACYNQKSLVHLNFTLLPLYTAGFKQKLYGNGQ